MKVIHLHFKKSQYCAWYRMPLTCILETLGPAFLDIQKEYRGDESEYELCTEIGEKIIQEMRTASQKGENIAIIQLDDNDYKKLFSGKNIHITITQILGDNEVEAKLGFPTYASIAFR